MTKTKVAPFYLGHGVVTTKNKFCWYLITSHPRDRYMR